MRSGDSNFPISWNEMSLFWSNIELQDTPIIINNKVQCFLNQHCQDH